ncbi:MAG: murein hydrolase activator EnvC family protein [Culicoidibacterales bacterium]
MKKNVAIILALALGVGVFSVFDVGIFEANTLNCDSVENCDAVKKDIASQKEAKKNELEEARNDVTKQAKILYLVGDQRKTLESEISVLGSSIQFLAVQEGELVEEIGHKEQRVAGRLTVMQKQNNVDTFLTILAKSTSLTDLIRRWSALELINSKDKELMDDLHQTKVELVANKQKFTEDKSILEGAKEAIAKIEAAEEEQLKVMAKNSERLENQIQDIVLSEGEVQQQSDAAKAYKEELERKRREEEEQRRKEEEEKKKPAPVDPGPVDPGPVDPGPVDPAPVDPAPVDPAPVDPAPVEPPPVKKTWYLPAEKGWVSCEMWCYPNHIGTDFAMPEWTRVYAVADAKVIYTSHGYSGGFGNMIVLYHYINGVDYVTIYAHLNEINVNVGQTLSGGELIGYSGNTGASEGPHLHLELLVGIDYYPGSKAVRVRHAESILAYISGSWKWNW